MAKAPNIGVIGDFDASNETHRATSAELEAAGATATWVATPTVGDADKLLHNFDGLLISPGSPYVDMDGALTAIRCARERGMPLVGTCGGFQHVVLEFARDVLGVAGADHAETSPDADCLAVTPLACSLVGQRHPVRLSPGTRAAAIYGRVETVEPYFCSFGLNPNLEPELEAHGLRISGRDELGNVRVVELESHPFFVATLYVFQARGDHRHPHPLTAAFLEAAR
jgi:CTP synthase (UTP-ammonia lyase)